MKKIFNFLPILSTSLVFISNSFSCSTNKINEYTYDNTSLNVYSNVFSNILSSENKNICNDKTNVEVDDDFSDKNQGYSFFLDQIKNNESDVSQPYFTEKTSSIDNKNINGFILDGNFKNIYSQGSTITSEQYRNAFENDSDNSVDFDSISSFQISLDSLAEKLDINPNETINYDDKNKKFVSSNDPSVFYDMSPVTLNINKDSIFYYLDYKQDSSDNNYNLYYFLNEEVNFHNYYNNEGYKEKISIMSPNEFKLNDLVDKNILDSSVNLTVAFNEIDDANNNPVMQSDELNKKSILININESETNENSLDKQEKNIENNIIYFLKNSGITNDSTKFEEVETNNSLINDTDSYNDNNNDDNNNDDNNNDDNNNDETNVEHTYRCFLGNKFVVEDNEIPYIDIHYTEEVEK